MNFLFIDWQPSIDAFSIFGFGVKWYSILWCVGLIVAYQVVQRLYKQQNIEERMSMLLFSYCFVGVLIGARLGHCIFYQADYYLTSWKGFVEMIVPIHIEFDGSWKYTGYAGLASHGGAIGLLVAIILYWKKTGLKLLTVLDNIAIAVPAAACCIRIGNLMNSEIVGKTTDVAWAFIFHSPDSLVNGALVPRHPAQLYEAIVYLVLFVVGILIYRHWRKVQSMSDKSSIAVGTGFYFGLCLTAIFIFRFFVEFIKKEQVAFEQGLFLDMGQILSIPFIIIGVYCLLRASRIKND